MNNTILARPPQTGQQIVDMHGAEVLELPMFDVNPGVEDHMSVPAKIGDRYVLIYRQGPIGSPFNREGLTADRVNPADPDFLGSNPQPGFQWGWDDKDDSQQFVFTVVGVYVLDAIIPHLAMQTFSASFHRAPQEMTA